MHCLVTPLVNWHRMDQQLDLSLQQLLSLESAIYVCADMYLQTEFSDLWKKLEEFQAILLPIPKIGKNSQKEDFGLFFKNKEHIFGERKNIFPHAHMHRIL